MPALAFNDQPTPGLPVKLRNLMRPSSTSGLATCGPQGTTAMPPAGQPAASTISASLTADTGVCSDGLMMIGLPAAMAGATLGASGLNGKLKGVMPVMGPRGSRRAPPARPSVPGSQSSGMTSP